MKKDHDINLHRARLAKLLSGSILGVDDVLPPRKTRRRRRRVRRKRKKGLS